MPPKPLKQKDPDYREMYNVLTIFDAELTEQHIRATINAFDQKLDDPYFLVPLNNNYTDLTENLLGINVLIGPDGIGRKSCVRYANREQRYPILNISCRLFSTQHQFMNRLFMECSRLLGHEIPPYESVSTYNLASLTPLVKQPILIVVDHCEKLNDVKRQGVLYNLLEWIKKEVNKYVGLHLITSDTGFFNGLEKRVKSRLTAKTFYFFPPEPKAVIEMLAKRLRVGWGHIKFIERLDKLLNSKEFFELIEKNLWNLGSMTIFVTAFKHMLTGIKVGDVKGFVIDHEKEHLSWLLKDFAGTLMLMSNYLLESQLRVSRTEKGGNTTSFSTPALIVLAVIINMIDRKCTINLQTIFRNFVKIKMQLKERQGIGSVTEYGEGHISKGLNFLQENGMVMVEEPPDGTVVVNGQIHELKQLLLNTKGLPPLVRDIVGCEGV